MRVRCLASEGPAGPAAAQVKGRRAGRAWSWPGHGVCRDSRTESRAPVATVLCGARLPAASRPVAERRRGRGGQLPGWQTGACTPSPGTASGAARGPVQLTTDPAADTSDLYGASPGSCPSLWGVGQGPRVGQALPFYGHQRTCWTTVSGEQGVERTKPQNCRRKKINLFLTCVQTGVCTKK